MVPPPQVSLSVPRAVTLHWPVQVMLQVPAAQTTELPAPTVWVHELPLQLTLQLAPQVPVQVAVEPQLKLQPLVEAVQASKAQLSLAGQSQEVPTQTVSVQAVAKSVVSIQATKASLFMGIRAAKSPGACGQ